MAPDDSNASQASNNSIPPSCSSSINHPTGGLLNCITAFDETLQQIGQISPQDFTERYGSGAEYLPQISWDVTTAQFWDEFNLDPAQTHQDPDPKKRRGADFRLSEAEFEIFKTNGFVVSERLGAANFTDLFYRIYSNDLPVFVSADAILHAWHRSYDSVLEELEETYLALSLNELLSGMAEGIPECATCCGEGILHPSVIDADYFLAVARSLLIGEVVSTYLYQDPRVLETLEAIENLKLQGFSLFGRGRQIDFSQFKVRGHYENSQQLRQYFRAMMWCGKIDLRIAGNADEASLRELGGAIVLHQLLKQANKFEQWQQFDELLQTFVGQTDSMTFAQLEQLLESANVQSLTDVDSWDALAQVQAIAAHSQLGVQGIVSDPYQVSSGTTLQLPHSFTVMGQKFVLDSWVTSKVVFDAIEWDGVKVQRRIPSSLDVAFAVFGNDQVVPDLIHRVTGKQGRLFRDGLNYQHNLAALRQVIDSQEESIWKDNIYMCWLATLRELSAPTTSSDYPEAIQTHAWAMKTLNTQLASWTQLRHDTILYVKQSATISSTCFYPAGFVEPRLTFWEQFQRMAERTAQLIEKIPFPTRSIERELKTDEDRKWAKKYKAVCFQEDSGQQMKGKLQLQDVKNRQVAFFRNFAGTVANLKELAQKELAQEEFTETDVQFLRKIVEIIHRGSGDPTYSGWYFSLFYQGYEDSKKWDVIVADMHTDFPNPDGSGDPGCVLHQGVGNVDLLMIAVDSGHNKMIYAGPVLSHYEFEMPTGSRKSDSEWQEDLKNGKCPPRPEWTNEYVNSQNALDAALENGNYPLAIQILTAKSEALIEEAVMHGLSYDSALECLQQVLVLCRHEEWRTASPDQSYQSELTTLARIRNILLYLKKDYQQLSGYYQQAIKLARRKGERTLVALLLQAEAEIRVLQNRGMN
ncbi:DUF3160 domain-containing protein [Cyanobacteria bacterium FACHB-471]|nr:DUF3160 domain-containing protein [Cyanobacteria bacterium FACHB-471]